MKTRSCAELKRPRHRQRGTAAVEFAIIGFWLIMLLGAIAEVGVFLLIQFELQNAADRAARLIRTNQISETTTLADFKSTVCEKLVINDCASKIFVDVRNATSFSNLAQTLPIPSNAPPNVGPGTGETFSLGSAGNPGSVVITYDWRLIFPFLRPFSNVGGAVRRLYGVAIYKNEM